MVMEILKLNDTLFSMALGAILIMKDVALKNCWSRHPLHRLPV